MLQEDAYYHGSSSALGIQHQLLPPSVTGVIQEVGRKKNLDKVFFTKDIGSARIYAGRAVRRFGGDPIVYRAIPMGDVEEIQSAPGTTVYSAAGAFLEPLTVSNPPRRFLKKLGKRIYEALWSDDGHALADELNLESFHAGGCYGFAYALQKWLGCGDVWVIVRGGEYPPQAQHVVLKIGGLFFDGAPKNAAKTQEELFDYWALEISDPRLIAMEGPELDRRAAAEVRFDEGTKCSINAVDEIVAFLKEQIPDPENVCVEINPMYPETEEKFEMANPAAPAVSGYEGMRVEYTPAKKLPFSHPFREPQDMVGFARANRLMDDTRERFYAVYLNQQNAPLGYRLIGAGGPASAPVDPAVLFGPAMALQASSVAFLHNHPSGTARFSPSDVALTERLLWVARMMGLRVLDHVLIVPSGSAMSMREEHPKLMWEYDPAARAIAPDIQVTQAANPKRKKERTMARKDTDELINSGINELRKAYYGAIKDLAQDYKERINDGEFDDRESLLDDIHQSIDGWEWVIYTHKAKIVVLVSDNSEYSLDEGLVELSGNEIPWPQLAYGAIEADLYEQLDAEGVDVNDPIPEEVEDE